MNPRLLLLAAMLALGGCAGHWSTNYETQLAPDVTRGWSLAAVAVSVPEGLTVSEINRLAPNADIVWHGDPEGDRRAQVAAILHDGVARGGTTLAGTRPVTFAVTLEEFHAVTPAAVAIAPAAVHHISYTIQVFDGATSAPLTAPEHIRADLQAYTGSAAIVAGQQGQTQKVRIVNHLDLVTRSWLGMGADVRRDFTSFGR